MDKYFQVKVLPQTPEPQRVIYAALHQDYSEHFVWDELTTAKDSFLLADSDLLMAFSNGNESPFSVWDGPSEAKCGQVAVERLLKGGRGHWGPLEHPQIVFNCGWFPHSTMQQIRTHRHASFDVQSFRYSGKRFLGAYDQIGMLDLDSKDPDIIQELFYIRPAGDYTDRQGKKYTVTTEQREEDIEYCWEAIRRYRNRVVRDGYSEEHARSMIPFDVRQHWVVSCNMRSLIHLLSIRGKTDAQMECQQWAELVLPHFKAWAPEIYGYFEQHQWKKGRLAP